MAASKSTPPRASVDQDERRARGLIALGVGLSIFGIVLVATQIAESASWLILTGWATLAWGTHRFGRLGPPADAIGAAAIRDGAAAPRSTEGDGAAAAD